MNKLPLAKRAKILSLLCEGVSMRAISRHEDVSINTVTKLLEEVGEAAVAYHDEHVRGVRAKRVQCDEIWSFCYTKDKNVKLAKRAPAGAGDVWTWTGIDADSKLLISYMVGGRDAGAAKAIMADLKERLATRVQLTTDGHRSYLDAVDEAFGDEIDYAMLVKIYGTVPLTATGRYSPGECIGAEKNRIQGEPDEKHVSTSYVERSNLTMRMHMRRFTRLTNAFSKKLANHCHMIALYALWYNFVRQHKTLRVSPAMAAGVADRLWNFEDVVGLVDAAAPAPAKRGPYKKAAVNSSPDL